jgi:polyphosphate kinase 2 (PPK2 family)
MSQSGKSKKNKDTSVKDKAKAETSKSEKAVAKVNKQAADIMSPETTLEESPPKPDYPRYHVRPDQPITLADFDPDECENYKKQKDVAEELEYQRDRVGKLQQRLYAENKRSLLIVLQAMDTGGKDGTIKHVFSGVNPQGCRVWSFKHPSEEESNHDFLWRYHQKTPQRGMITIFNRSHYEDVLIVRVKNLVQKKFGENAIT